MWNHKKPTLVLIVLLSISIVTAMAAMRNQNQSGVPAAKQVEKPNLPVTDYNAPEPTDPGKKLLRSARGRHYDNHDPTIKGDRINLFRLSENSQSSYGGPASHAPVEPALPASQSDAIVTGEVTDASAHLSNDKTSIYSEFTVGVSEVIKNASPVSLAVGNTITVERYGGAVRFPSGKIVERALLGKPLPSAGRKYLFFLKYDVDGQDYSIITGYELRAGIIFPLDGQNEFGNVQQPYSAYQKYKGMEEQTFLNEVRQLTY
ncbi:MAG: hypothetical protein M3444_04465 [Acidobacteriota bacterium]|nr:hypothetical protein [Acidobacteriota bacterium]